ncbi:MAG: hypothetical protein ABIX28_11130 [Vicinamibacterales bacterium]
MQPTTGGVSVALEALMRARGGTWVAAGTGSADRDVVGSQDRVAVPVDKPAYALRRIWLSEEEDRRLETPSLDGIESWRHVAGGPAVLNRLAESASNVRG